MLFLSWDLWFATSAKIVWVTHNFFEDPSISLMMSHSWSQSVACAGELVRWGWGERQPMKYSERDQSSLQRGKTWMGADCSCPAPFFFLPWISPWCQDRQRQICPHLVLSQCLHEQMRNKQCHHIPTGASNSSTESSHKVAVTSISTELFGVCKWQLNALPQGSDF